MTPRFVICGVEHTGTTLVSDVFRQVNGLESGFEVGALLVDTPNDFLSLEPFISNMLAGWDVTESQLKEMCQLPTFAAFYQKLKEHSFIENTNEIFDKTPRYFLHLGTCINKVDCNFIATYKDPRSMVFSDFKRARNHSFEQWFPDYSKGKLNYLLKIYKQYQAYKNDKSGRVFITCLEDMALNTRQTFEKMFELVGVEFKIEYLLMKNLRYKNTKASYISSQIPFEYMDKLSEKQINLISDKFKPLSDWFYD